MSRRPSVAVLIELERGPEAGGHVKCWENLAAAATSVPEVDLTLYVLARRGAGEVEELSDNVRFVSLPPALSSRPLTGLVGGVDASDVAPYHWELGRRLPRHDVWHVTHDLAFTRTAVRRRRRVARPVVASVHTDVPTLTRLYTDQVVDSLPPPLRTATRRTGLDRIPHRVALAHQRRLLQQCTWILVSNETDRDRVSAAAPDVPLSMLRRGVDTDLFVPRSDEDRAWLREEYAVPDGVPRALFAGRVDVTKGAVLAAQAVARARERGVPVHMVVAGDGAGSGAVQDLLGEHVTMLGRVPQDALARVYAGCDALVFPSQSETAGNVVGEAMAAKLPVLLPRGARTERWLAEPGRDGVLVDGEDPDAWAAALCYVLGEPATGRAIGERAHRTVVSRRPSWETVLCEDLLPVWQAVTTPRVPVGPAWRPAQA